MACVLKKLECMLNNLPQCFYNEDRIHRKSVIELLSGSIAIVRN